MSSNKQAKNKAGYILEVDRDLCATLAICLGIAPDVFELDAHGKAVIKDPDGADLDTIIEAAKGCPLNAIIIKHPNGKRIWPDPEVNVDGKLV